ncbi:MAG TPA: hypothetical protein VF862_03220 [Gemmatimonadales bacterium]
MGEVGRFAGVIVVLVLVAATAPLAAQAPMVPLHGGPIEAGAELAVTVGFNDDDVPELRGTSYSGSFGYGFGRVGLSATAGAFAAEAGRSRLTLGALATVHLYGDGVTTPLTLGLFGGMGWLAESDLLDDTVRHFPVGATAALTIATPVLSIRPWLSPRLDVVSCDPPSTQDVTALCWDDGSRFGLSGGIDLRFPKGFALRALSDYVDGGSPFVGVGAAYSF